MKLPRVVVFISGSGTNLQALIDAVQEGALEAEIVLVVSNRKAAYGLERAKRAGIETLYKPLGPYRERDGGREQYDRDLAAKIAGYEPDLIVLAGWMLILGPLLLDRFPARVINLHPALPGEFAGTNAIERAFAAFQRGEITHSGCMVHYAVPEVDAGKVIAQTIVPIHAEESMAQFEERMHQAEHRLIVEATRGALASSSA